MKIGYGLVAITWLAVVTSCATVESRTSAGDSAERQRIIDELIAASAQQDGGTGILFWSDKEREVGFGSIDSILPTRRIEAGAEPFPLPAAPQDFSGLTYTVDGQRYSFGDFVAMPENRGLIVVKDGKVLYERYAPGNDDTTRWISFSVTKSITSMLIGAAIQDGFIRSVDEPVANYLPRLRGTPYEDSTIEHVLTMSSGVAWNEDYADPASDVSRAGGANGITLVEYLSKLPRDAEPGARFNYNTGETNLVGEILRSAIGNNAATYLEHRIWKPFGMEHDAYWSLGSAGGGELGGCCINATLRDYARIGIFALREGQLPDGTRVLPSDWMARSTAPSPAAPFYGYLWWLRDDGAFAADGIFGQQIFIDPANQLVIAMHSNEKAATGTSYGAHSRALVEAIRQQVSNP